MNRWNIGRRLAFGFGAVLVLAMLTLSLAMWRMQSNALATQSIMAEPLVKERLISDWYAVVHTGIRRITAIVKSSDPSLEPLFAPEIAESTKVLEGYQAKLVPLLRGTDEKRLFEAFLTERKRFTQARDAIVQAQKDGRTTEANAIFNEQFVPASKGYVGNLQSLLDEQRRSIDAAAAALDASNANSRVLLPLLGVVTLLLGAGFAWTITRSVTVPIRSAVRAAQQVASGDLTAELSTGGYDETGQLLTALGQMQTTLSNMIGSIRQSTDSISTASAEIASGSLDLSQRTEHTASSLQQAASSMEQLNTTVRQTAESARLANQLACSSTAVAQRGGDVVSQVVSTMDDINTSSKRIVDIIGVIDSIAFQTNILALNAAVEAARAGEQGRGFAVVASEVRNLAQRSAQAAKEIKQLIGASVDRVSAGTLLVTDAGQTMREIVASVQRVTDIIGEINSATSEQSDGIGRVSEAVAQLDELTQQNAALVEQSAAAASSLKEQSMNLAGSVRIFKLQG